MWQIIKNEWRFLLRSRILLGLGIFFILILMLSVFLGSAQVNSQAEKLTDAKDHVRQKWVSIDEMNPHAAAHYGTYVFKPANLLSSLDEGVNSITGNVLRVEGHVQNEILHSEASQMQTISRFGKLKSSLLLQIILPIFLIFLAFNAVSSEKNSGRLKLLLMQGAKPIDLMLSKTISVWIYSLLMLMLVIIVYMILNLDGLNLEILLRTSLFFLSYALYYFIVCGLSIYFSARWQNATLALTSMMGIWILWSIFIPNMLMSSIEKWHPLPSRNDFQTSMKEDRSKGIDGHNPRDERIEELKKKVLKQHAVSTIEELPFNFNGIRMQADEEYGNSVWDKHFGSNTRILERQKQSYQWAGIINPFISLQNSSMGFMATDNAHHQDFLLQVEKYRRVFIKMLNDEYTVGEGDADNAFFQSVPDFNYKSTPLSSVLTNYILDLIFLLLWATGVLGLIIFVSKKLKIV